MAWATGTRIVIGLAWIATVLLVAGALFTVWRTSWTERSFPPSGTFFDAGAVRLHYQVSGQPSADRPSLILLHGASTNLNDFSALKDALPDHWHLVLVDRPGAGYSSHGGSRWLTPLDQATAVLALQTHLGQEQAVWVGHSLAGSLVMAALAAWPERVSGGVMLAAAAYPWDGGVDLLDHLPGVPVLGPLISHTLIAPAGALRFEAGIQTAFAPNSVPPAYRQQSAIDLYLRPGQFMATGRDIRRLSAYLEKPSQKYTEIQQPVLLIHGEADTIVPAWNHADRLVDVLPDVQYERLADTGHQPHHVHTQQVSQWIQDFIQERMVIHSRP